MKAILRALGVAACAALIAVPASMAAGHGVVPAVPATTAPVVSVVDAPHMISPLAVGLLVGRPLVADGHRLFPVASDQSGTVPVVSPVGTNPSTGATPDESVGTSGGQCMNGTWKITQTFLGVGISYYQRNTWCTQNGYVLSYRDTDNYTFVTGDCGTNGSPVSFLVSGGLGNATWTEHGQAEIMCNAGGLTVYGTLWMEIEQALWASWVTASGGGSVSGA